MHHFPVGDIAYFFLYAVCVIDRPVISVVIHLSVDVSQLSSPPGSAGARETGRCASAVVAPH
jgi:hypothetical protein